MLTALGEHASGALVPSDVPGPPACLLKAASMAQSRTGLMDYYAHFTNTDTGGLVRFCGVDGVTWRSIQN